MLSDYRFLEKQANRQTTQQDMFCECLLAVFSVRAATALPLLPFLTAADAAGAAGVAEEEQPLVGAALVLVVVAIALCALLALSVVALLAYAAYTALCGVRSVKLEHGVAGALADEFEVEERLAELSPNEQSLFRAGQEYIKQHPPYGEELSLSTHLAIQEKGVQAWEFVPDMNLPADAITVHDRTELHFTSFDYQCCVQANLPIPKTNDVYYFETKIFQLDSPEDTIVSMGLATRPYPYFRLPGRHLYSVAYDSNGSRRVNNSFKLAGVECTPFPKLQRGDVVGVGYRVRSGTIFFTRNGKKVSEKPLGGHVKGMKMNNLYPTIGSNNPCVVNVNLGQVGYVFIEGNIKKWGYGTREGTRPPLPQYNDSSLDLLLESSNEDDEDIVDPPDFFDNAAYESTNGSFRSEDDITLNTLLPKEPPVYQEAGATTDEEVRHITELNQFLRDCDDVGDDVDDYEARNNSNPRELSPEEPEHAQLDELEEL